MYICVDNFSYSLCSVLVCVSRLKNYFWGAHTEKSYCVTYSHFNISLQLMYFGLGPHSCVALMYIYKQMYVCYNEFMPDNL